MSKETDQAITSIATVAGCIETLRITKAFARIDIKRAMDICFDACGDAIRGWPGFSNMPWVNNRREDFKAFIRDEPDTGYSSLAVIRMCSMILADMLDEYDYSRDKSALLAPIQAEVDKLVAFADPTGANFQALDKAWYLVDAFYKIIGKKEFAK